MGSFRRRPKGTKGRLRGENPVRLRACALAHRIFPLRTPITRDAELACQFYDRREVIRIDSAFVFAQRLYCAEFRGGVLPTTRLTRRSSLRGRQFYRLSRAAAGGRNGSNQVLRAGQPKFSPKGLPRQGYIRGGQPLIRAFGDFCRVTKVTPAERCPRCSTKHKSGAARLRFLISFWGRAPSHRCAPAGSPH